MHRFVKWVQAETGETVGIAIVNQGYNWENAQTAPPSTEPSLKWSNCQLAREVLSCCLADGWSIEVLVGWRGFAAWLAIMNDYPKLQRICII